MWYGVLGFLITLFGGWLASILYDCMHIGGEKKIFLDSTENYMDPDLFSPPIARRMRQRNAKLLEKDANVSFLLHSRRKLINFQFIFRLVWKYW